MAYQRFDNGPPPPSSSIQGVVQQQNTTTVMAAGATQPSPIIVAQQPYNHFAAKASVTQKLGISILVFGILTVILGVIMLSVAMRYWTSFIASGVWSGIFVIIAGSLCIGAGSNANNTCARVGALVMCIFGMLATFSSGILMFIGFAIGVGCDHLSCYTTTDIWGNVSYQCYNECGWRDAKDASYLSLVVAILNLIAFILMLVASVYTGRGCCCHGNNYQGTAVMLAPQQSYGGPVVVSSNQATYSQSHASAPQPQNYPAQPQRYSQAAMPTSSGGQVAYGNDYHQQQRQEEQKVMPPQDAPPAYS